MTPIPPSPPLPAPSQHSAANPPSSTQPLAPPPAPTPAPAAMMNHPKTWHSRANLSSQERQTTRRKKRGTVRLRCLRLAKLQNLRLDRLIQGSGRQWRKGGGGACSGGDRDKHSWRILQTTT